MYMRTPCIVCTCFFMEVLSANCICLFNKTLSLSFTIFWVAVSQVSLFAMSCLAILSTLLNSIATWKVHPSNCYYIPKYKILFDTLRRFQLHTYLFFSLFVVNFLCSVFNLVYQVRSVFCVLVMSYSYSRC